MQRSVNLGQSLLFAQLSGDYNPLHIDPIKARRLRFGGTVVHGIHLLLIALDGALISCAVPRRIASLKAKFESPVFTGQKFATMTDVHDVGSMHLSVAAPRLAVEVALVTVAGKSHGNSQIDLRACAPAFPKSLKFEDAVVAEGNVPLTLATALAAELFPNVVRWLPPEQIAALVATSRIIGMECPGEHSIFTGVELQFEENLEHLDLGVLAYDVEKADERFESVFIRVRGRGVHGRLTALYRNPPVRQLPYSEIRRQIAAGSFSGQRALIIGGSRGLGEVTAKIIASGGGDVAITYCSGVKDAELIAEEIKAGDGSCAIAAYNVETAAHNFDTELASDWNPSHVYYFATPFIRFHRGPWDPELLQYFCRYYVDGFAACVDLILRHFPEYSGKRVFIYPSTTFISKLPADGLEYTAAKAAGEVLCRGLTKRNPSVDIRIVRLRRLLTDQTGAVRGVAVPCPVTVLAKLVSSVHRTCE
jgi:acyl dehydratase